MTRLCSKVHLSPSKPDFLHHVRSFTAEKFCWLQIAVSRYVFNSTTVLLYAGRDLLGALSNSCLWRTPHTFPHNLCFLEAYTLTNIEQQPDIPSFPTLWIALYVLLALLLWLLHISLGCSFLGAAYTDPFRRVSIQGLGLWDSANWLLWKADGLGELFIPFPRVIHTASSWTSVGNTALQKQKVMSSHTGLGASLWGLGWPKSTQQRIGCHAVTSSSYDKRSS